MSSDKSKLLPIGSEAPDFELPDHTGAAHRLSDLREKSGVVLIFYPSDHTPVCTSQLCEVRDSYERLGEKGIVAFGINGRDAGSHESFTKKHSFPFPLLTDREKQAIKAYHCAGMLWTTRTVYGINKDGKIIFAQRGKPPVDEVLKAFEEDGG